MTVMFPSSLAVSLVSQSTNIIFCRKRMPVNMSSWLHFLHISMTMRSLIIYCSSGVSICFGIIVGRMACQMPFNFLSDSYLHLCPIRNYLSLGFGFELYGNIPPLWSDPLLLRSIVESVGLFWSCLRPSFGCRPLDSSDTRLAPVPLGSISFLVY